MSAGPHSGGCQCGAVRFCVSRLGGSAICHCRMCQKAFGSLFGTLVTAHELEWTRGQPAEFRSSNLATRGFCARCGTPLTYRADGDATIEVAVGAFDDPTVALPARHVNAERRYDFVMHLDRLPTRPPGAAPDIDAFHDRVVSHQHPDHETASWPAAEGSAA
jgi:hypothetical protein